MDLNDIADIKSGYRYFLFNDQLMITLKVYSLEFF